MYKVLYSFRAQNVTCNAINCRHTLLKQCQCCPMRAADGTYWSFRKEWSPHSWILPVRYPDEIFQWVLRWELIISFKGGKKKRQWDFTCSLARAQLSLLTLLWVSVCTLPLTIARAPACKTLKICLHLEKSSGVAVEGNTIVLKLFSQRRKQPLENPQKGQCAVM